MNGRGSCEEIRRQYYQDNGIPLAHRTIVCFIENNKHECTIAFPFRWLSSTAYSLAIMTCFLCIVSQGNGQKQGPFLVTCIISDLLSNSSLIMIKDRYWTLISLCAEYYISLIDHQKSGEYFSATEKLKRPSRRVLINSSWPGGLAKMGHF